MEIVMDFPLVDGETNFHDRCDVLSELQTLKWFCFLFN